MAVLKSVPLLIFAVWFTIALDNIAHISNICIQYIQFWWNKSERPDDARNYLTWNRQCEMKHKFYYNKTSVKMQQRERNVIQQYFVCCKTDDFSCYIYVWNRDRKINENDSNFWALVTTWKHEYNENQNPLSGSISDHTYYSSVHLKCICWIVVVSLIFKRLFHVS